MSKYGTQNCKFRSNMFIMHIPNDEMFDRHFTSLKRAYRKLGWKIRARGRHSNRKKLFFKYGHRYVHGCANANDIPMTMKKDVEYFAIYKRTS